MDPVELLARVDILAGVERSVVEDLAAHARTQVHPPGHAIVRVGEPGDELHVIVSGHARVVVDGRPRRDLGPGFAFGEISILDGGPRSASVYAVTEVATLVVAAASFQAALDASEPCRRAVTRNLAQRLRGLEADRWVDAEEARLRELQQLFLTNIGHELRTPLTVAMTAVQLLPRLHHDPDKLTTMAERAHGQLRHLHGLIEDLLELSHAAQSDVTLEADDEALRHLIEAAVTEVEVPADRVRVQGADDIVVHVDGPRIRRAIAALIDNAVKFGPDDQPITVRVSRQDAQLWIDVSDDGPGIPPDELGAVFDPFNQRDPSSTRARGGMGIGLPLARTAIQRHGGTVDYVESAPTTTFRITIPL